MRAASRAVADVRVGTLRPRGYVPFRPRVLRRVAEQSQLGERVVDVAFEPVGREAEGDGEAPHERRRDGAAVGVVPRDRLLEPVRGEPLDDRAVDPRRRITPAVTRIVAQHERHEGARHRRQRGCKVKPQRVDDAKPRTHQHPEIPNLLRHLVREHHERLGPPRGWSARQKRKPHRGAIREVVHGVGDEVEVPDRAFPFFHRKGLFPFIVVLLVPV